MQSKGGFAFSKRQKKKEDIINIGYLKKQSMKNKFLLILLFFSFIFASSKNGKQSKSPVGLTETEAYKMLYENQVKANDNILKTLTYALGGLGTAVLLVFASNWWFNEKKVKDAMNDIDNKISLAKSNIFSELSNKINLLNNEKVTEINQMQKKLNEDANIFSAEILSKFNDFSEKIRLENINLNKDSQKQFQELLKSYNENFTQQFLNLKENNDEKINTLTNKINEIRLEFHKKIDKSSIDINRNLLAHEAELYLMKGNNNIALKGFVDLALFEVRNGESWRVKYSSNKIITCLEKITYIYTDEIAALKELEEIYPSEFSELLETINNLSRNKTIKNLHQNLDNNVC